MNILRANSLDLSTHGFHIRLHSKISVSMIKNPRISVFSTTDPQFTDDEIPAHFQTKGSMHAGSNSVGDGDIVLTKRRIVFVPSIASSAVAIDYKAMVMHAVTGDSQGKYIFIQMLSDEDEEQEVEDEIIKLIPTDQAVVQALFEAINEMSALNPDEENDMSDMEFDACADEGCL